MDRAAELKRVLYSEDEDMLAIAHVRLDEGIPFSGVIYAHQDRVAIGRCVENLHLIAQCEDFEEYANRVQYLPL